MYPGCGKDPVPGINDEDKKPGTEVPGNTDKPDDPGNTDDPDDPENQKPAVELTLPADPKPASISFSHRILLVQHTGTYCPNCPRLMTSLKELALDEADAGIAAKTLLEGNTLYIKAGNKSH